MNAMGSGSRSEELWRLHADELVRYGALLVGPVDAHDVVSSAFLKARRSLEGGAVVEPRAYLFRVVTNEAHNHRRALANRWRRDLRLVAAGPVAAVDGHLDVRRALADLSIRQRAIVYLAYWEDMTERAIAEYLQLSPGSVRRHLTRARVHLRKALDDD